MTQSLVRQTVVTSQPVRAAVTPDVARANHLLASLPPEELAALCASAEPIHLRQRGTTLAEPGEPIRFVHFPLRGLVSVVRHAEAGGSVEVGPVGSDGFVGLPAFLGGETDLLEAFVQVEPVETVRLPVTAFRSLAERLPALQRVLRRYTQWTYFSMAQWVLCARLHPLEERLSRWLLMCHDRLGTDQFPLTHEYLAEMLGVRRAGVTVAAGTLRSAGLIEYQRAVVTIRDRAGLEDAACECNRVTAAEYRRLIGRGPTAASPH